MALIGLAAMMKFTDVEGFADSLKTWTLIPRNAIMALSVGVPTLEGLAALAWFLGVLRPWTLGLAACLMSAFTVMYLVQTMLVGPPDCTCYGALVRYKSTQGLAWEMIVRNTLILMSLIAGGFVMHHDRSRGQGAIRISAPRPGGGRIGGTRRGFTVLELLIVIVLIGVLVSLFLPALGGVRKRTQQLQVLTNLRTHAQAHTLYAGDNGESFLYATDPNVTLTALRGGGAAVAVPYFYLAAAWPVALADGYYNGSVRHPSFRVPWKVDNSPFTFYFYGDCFITRPEYWAYTTRLSGTSQLRGATIAEVNFPSAKGLILERGWPNDGQGRITVDPQSRCVLVDGSTQELPFATLRSPYVHGSGPFPRPGLGNENGTPVIHTIDGVRGRDLP